MKYTEFFKKYKGKKIDYDGMYGVQCVDLIDRYITDVLQLKINFFGNAKLWWTNRNKSQWLKGNFYFITPTYSNNETRRGDIGIRSSGTYGHIFVIDNLNSNGTFSYYDCNGGGNGEAVTLRTRPYNSKYINGILRPKNQKNIDGVKIYGNASIVGNCPVFSSSELDSKVGALYFGDRVLKLGTGRGRPIVTYQITNGYKVGFINEKYLKED